MSLENIDISMDRLLEFGIEAAAAQQMIRNITLSNPYDFQHSPVAKNTGVYHQEMIYYVLFEGKQAGPFSVSELSRLISEKKVVKETLVWRPGMAEWKKAEDVPDVLKLVALVPPPIPEQ